MSIQSRMTPAVLPSRELLIIFLTALLFHSAFAANPTAPGTRPLPPSPCPGLPPYMPTVASCETHNHIQWMVTMASQFTTCDSIWVDTHVRNNADRRVIFTKKGAVVAELISSGGSSRLATISPGDGLKTEKVDRTPAPDEDAYAVRADLKAYFGKLEPGTYRVRFHWPSDAYRIEGLPGYVSKDLESAWHAFEVNAIDLDKVGGSPAYLMIARKGPPDPTVAGPLPVGTLTNTHPASRFIEILSSPDGKAAAPGQPLRVHMNLSRLENGGAAPAQFYWQPWKARTIPNEALRELKPGETIEISLPDWQCEGDGVYCYTIDIYHKVAGHPEPYLLGQAFSKPFVIDRVDISAPTASNPTTRPTATTKPDRKPSEE